MRSTRLFLSLLIAASMSASHAAAQQSAANLPDVVGIRPGMSAQEAYNALKARANGSTIGIAQSTMEGIQQPVVIVMALQVVGSSPREEITVYLTFPPQRQVVWNVVRTLTFEKGKEPTQASIVDGLRQKYGPETGGRNTALYWTYTQDGQRPDAREVMQNGCAYGGYTSQAQDFVNPAPISPVANMESPTKCDVYVALTAEIGSAFSATGALANTVTVGLTDKALAIRSRAAWKAIVDRENAAARQQEIDKAKQQNKPVF